jgi:HSP20 family protein
MLPILFNNSIDKFFEEFVNHLPTGSGRQVPPVNIHEDDSAYHLDLAAPGMNKEDFKVNLENGLLTISYEKKQTKNDDLLRIHRREYHSESFTRSFTVDEKINTENILARYENGILNVYLPKKEDLKAQPKQILIS